MSYQFQRRARPFGGRPRYNGNRGRLASHSPRFGGAGRSGRPSLNPSLYKNMAVAQEAETPYIAQHTFADFDLHPKLMENIRRHQYNIPTPIQDQAIPAMLQGRDVVGIANTGTGKTAVFLLPYINKVALDTNQGVLILAPTHELALQILTEFRMFAAGLPIGACLCIGGTNISAQIRTLHQNPHFVIGTPGRIKDLINRRAFNPAMFTNVVLDEVDRMLDIGFRNDIRFLISKLSVRRHSAFFSATMNRDAEQIMREFLTDPVQFTVKSKETSDHIHQDVVNIRPGENKVDVLHKLLLQQNFGKVIVFGRTKYGIKRLERQLSERGVRVTSIHGNKTHGARQRSLDEFKRGYVQALLATDVAARGIDIDDVTHVINFDEPQSYDDYVHRIGRTGRAGKTGVALTFVS